LFNPKNCVLTLLENHHYLLSCLGFINLWDKILRKLVGAAVINRPATIVDAPIALVRRCCWTSYLGHLSGTYGVPTPVSAYGGASSQSRPNILGLNLNIFYISFKFVIYYNFE
jgi:hypothetical protein